MLRMTVILSAIAAVFGRFSLKMSPFFATKVQGGDRKCAASRDGRVACWGALGGYKAGRLESGTPHLLEGVTDVVAVVSLQRAVCVLRRDGTGGCIPTDNTNLPSAFEAVEIAASISWNLYVRTRDGSVGYYPDTGTARASLHLAELVDIPLSCVRGVLMLVHPSANVRCVGLGRTYAPTRRAAAVHALDSVELTLAPGTTAPLGSVTCPAIDAS